MMIAIWMRQEIEDDMSETEIRWMEKMYYEVLTKKYIRTYQKRKQIEKERKGKDLEEKKERVHSKVSSK